MIKQLDFFPIFQQDTLTIKLSLTQHNPDLWWAECREQLSTGSSSLKAVQSLQSSMAGNGDITFDITNEIKEWSKKNAQ